MGARVKDFGVKNKIVINLFFCLNNLINLFDSYKSDNLGLNCSFVFS